ncbi:hypothetical protein H8E50_04255 [bacterium]|nr:hypothetical protein [bacterium]
MLLIIMSVTKPVKQIQLAVIILFALSFLAPVNAFATEDSSPIQVDQLTFTGTGVQSRVIQVEPLAFSGTGVPARIIQVDQLTFNGTGVQSRVIQVEPLTFSGTGVLSSVIQVEPLIFNGTGVPAGEFVPRAVQVLSMDFTGRGFVPQIIQVDPVNFTGRRFIPRVVQVGPMDFTGRRFVPKVIEVALMNFTGRGVVTEDGDGIPEGQQDASRQGQMARRLPGSMLPASNAPRINTGQANRREAKPIDDPIEGMARRSQILSAPVRTDIRTTILQVRSLNQNGNTDPFNFTDVQEDVVVAQTPEEEAQPTGEESAPTTTPTPTPVPSPTALSITNTGGFTAFSGDSIYLPVTDTGAGDFGTGPGADTALRLRNDYNNTTFVGAFSLFAHTGWTIISQTVANAVPEITSVTIVIRRDSDSNYFQFTMDAFIGTSSITFGSLSGFNCYSTAANCP